MRQERPASSPRKMLNQSHQTPLPSAVLRWRYGWAQSLAPHRSCHNGIIWPSSAGFLAKAQESHRWRHRRLPPFPLYALPYNVAVTVPEPIPEASALPDEPALRSEHIDLTLSIKRCRTWQELRQLYWMHRTRHGVVNVVSYFTRLAALLPDLPRLLADETYEAAGTAAPDDHGEYEWEAGGGTAAGTGSFRTEGGGSGIGGGGERSDRHRNVMASGVSVRAPDSAGNVNTVSSHRQQQQQQQQRRSTADGQGAVAGSCTLSERAALRQMVIRLVYDACIFTEDQVAAGRLEEVLQNGGDPWDTDAYALYLAEYDDTLKQGWRQAGGGTDATSNRLPTIVTASVDGEENQQQQGDQQHLDALSLSYERALSFWDWVRDRPELWSDPVEKVVLEGLQHWNASTTISDVLNTAGGEGMVPGYPTVTTPAGAAVEAARRKRVPLCYGPLELTTLAWAAAKLQLHRAVPEHAAWLLHDLLYGSYRQMREFNGRQLAQLAYSLAQLGPCVPPARWQRKFLAATRRKLGDMDPQSLANLAHSLEPLQLLPDPAWLCRLLEVSGPLLEVDRLSGPELTQLGWAVFNLRRRLCRTRGWAGEILQVARTAIEYGSSPAVHPSSFNSSSCDGLPRADQRPATESGIGMYGSGTWQAVGRHGAGRMSGAAITPLLEFLPPLLEHIGTPLPPQRFAELKKLMLQPPDGRAQLYGFPADANSTFTAATVPLHPISSPNSNAMEMETKNPTPMSNLAGDMSAPTIMHRACKDVEMLAVKEGSHEGDTWVSDRAAVLLLDAVAGGGNSQPHSPLAEWLLRQHPMVFLLMRLWADATGSTKAFQSKAIQQANMGQGLSGEERAFETQLEVPGELEMFDRSKAVWVAFDYLQAVALHPKFISGTTTQLDPTSATVAQMGKTPAFSLVAASAGAAVPAAAVSHWLPSPSTPLYTPRLQSTPHRRGLTPQTQPSTAAGAFTAAGPLHVSTPSSQLLSRTAAKGNEDTRYTPLLFMLHTRCWPSARWLDAFATAATARLYTPAFRAQSLGMLLWSLAGLGYSPQSGWLQPWLQRTEELIGDFRSQNLVSVLCALSTWGELPTGGPAAALQAAAIRLLPTMGPRELQLMASALAQLCELPSPQQQQQQQQQPPLTYPPPPASPMAGPEESASAREGRGRHTVHRELSSRRGSNGAGGRGDGSGSSSRNKNRSGSSGVGLFVPLPVRSKAGDRPVAGGPGGVTRREGGPAAATGSSIQHVDHNGQDNYGEDDEDDDVMYGGNRGTMGPGFRQLPGSAQRSAILRHHSLEPQVGKLLVQRSIQVSYNYSPRHMARMLRLLVLRLGCLNELKDMQVLLNGHAVHLEGLAAVASTGKMRHGHVRRNNDVADSTSRRFGDEWDGSRVASGAEFEAWAPESSRRRELRELAGAVLDAARAIAPAGTSLNDEAAAMLLPGRWWRAYLAVLELSQ